MNNSVANSLSPNILNELYPSVDIVYDYGDDIAAKFPACQYNLDIYFLTIIDKKINIL
jgi:hypothetical protein